MHMVTARSGNMQMPVAEAAGSGNAVLYDAARSGIKEKRRVFNPALLPSLKTNIFFHQWRTIRVMLARYGTAFISMQPRAATTECDEVSQSVRLCFIRTPTVRERVDLGVFIHCKYLI